jgi:phosphoribosylanthranilate isomerase
MARVRVKICGLMRVEDALAAVAHGADALGLVFHPGSPRYVTPTRAAEICAALPPFVSTVGLFVDAAPGFLRECLAAVPLALLQFHGEEPPEACRGHGRPYMKALRVRPGLDVGAEAARYADAAGILLDAYDPAAPGGTGLAFDWRLIPATLARPWILAGGLTPENVGAALKRVRPYAVDVSSGVERARGVKDAARIAAFLQAVAAASP